MLNPAWGTARVLHGDALALPLPDSSVDLVVTSPPYFGLRSYQDGGEHYAGQIGSEATPAEFVDALIAATAEMVRVLKPSGSIWVNLGDKYGRGNRATTSLGPNAKTGRGASVNVAPTGYAKSLIGVPWRYAIRCIDDLGLILRAEVIWSKPNGLPESVTDRVRRSHETWFHFVKMPRYYSAVDEIREPHLQPDRKRADVFGGNSAAAGVRHAGPSTYTGPGDSLGKLPGSVWTIPTQPLTVPASLGIGHFAAFPMEWPRRIIRGWSPAEVCVACGEGRRPVNGGDACACTPRTSQRGKRGDWRDGREINKSQRAGESDTVGSLVARRPGGFGTKVPKSEGEWEYHFEGWEPTPTTPGVVLDPFGGTGTTALVAKVLGREGISVDLSADYCRLAEWRTTDPAQIASAMEVDKPAVQIPDQTNLFDLMEL